MNYSITMLEEHHERLVDTIFSASPLEGAAYLVCGTSVTTNETRLLVRDVVPIADEHYLVREPLGLSIDSASYVAVTKRARPEKTSLVFVHSHPGGYANHSPQDDREEPKLFEFFAHRIPESVHASVVFSGRHEAAARVFVGGSWVPVRCIRVIGNRFRFLAGDPKNAPISEFFERNVRAFGPDLQRLLSRLHVGVVGAGGTGSPVIEQLIRLGIGTLSVFDGDVLADSNVSRVFTGSAGTVGMNKAELARDLGVWIGVGTRVIVHPRHITEEATAKALRDCDVVFGCTDRQRPRAVLTQLSLRYLIPILDLGVFIDSEDGVLRGVEGRVTTLFPGAACLFCRERITTGRIAAEGLPEDRRRELAAEGYAPELGVPDPAVITFTTAVAAQAVTELLHRLSGFMGIDRSSTEVLLRFRETELRRNRAKPREGCLCTRRANWARGDARSFLGLTWEG